MARKLPKDAFFEDMARLHVALTFDDVRLTTGYSVTMPDDVSLGSKFSRNVQLKIPIVSAAMDTVTEHKLAIALAKDGGLGIIHRSLTPKKQAAEVARVKRHLNALIEDPICVYPNETIEAVLKRIEKEQWTFHTFPVVNRQNGRLVGVMTQNDFDLCDNYCQRVKNVMTSNVITAPKNTAMSEAYRIMTREKKKVLPLVDKNGRLSGMYVYSDVRRIMTGSSAMHNIDRKNRLLVGAAVGIGDDAFARLELLVRQEVDVIVIDTAHADSRKVIDTLKQIKKEYDIDVVVGNISEPESAKRLYKADADGIKVGQGPGSICTTRPIAGIGCPQVTAIYNCAKVLNDCDVPINADGGLRYSGDIPIAIGTGAHSVMMGNMLAGTDEAPGEVIILDGRKWKSYRGMGSLSAMEESRAARERYYQSDTGKSQLVPEGVEGLVPYKGKVSDIIFQYIGGLKRGMGYVGASTIEELREKADFRRITNSGQQESHPHNIRITKEAPNYP